MKAVDIMIRVLIGTFKNFLLEINWSKGKTEAFACLRGKNASKLYDSMRHDDGMYIEIPEEGAKLHVVKKYKHLGSTTCAGNSSMAYARA
eukprot:1587977-Heterocapsa_arctica.AAC.1